MRSQLYYLCLLAVYAAASPLHKAVELSRRDAAPASTSLSLQRSGKTFPRKRAPAAAVPSDDDDGCEEDPATVVVTKVVPVTRTKTSTRPLTATKTTSRTQTFFSTSTATRVVTKKVAASSQTTKTTSKASSTSKKASSTSSKPTQAATTTLSTLVTPIPTSSNYVFTGMSSWYYTGLGACGWWSNDGEMVAAVPDHVYDNFPGATPWWDTNGNPVCGKKINITWQSKTIQVTVVDRCVGCDTYQIDLSPTAFGALTDGNLDMGLAQGITWQWAQ